MKHELLKQEVERTMGRRLLVAHDYEGEPVAHDAEEAVGLPEQREGGYASPHAGCAGSLHRLQGL